MNITTNKISAQEMLDNGISKTYYVNGAVLRNTTLVLLFVAIAFQARGVLAEKIVCKIFSSQAEAQAHYSKALDRDEDGKACENLPK